MVIGLFIVTAIPTVTGISQAISAQKNREQREKDEERMKKFHIDIECRADDEEGQSVPGGRAVLKQDRVWIGPPHIREEGGHGYVAEAFLIEYPDKERVPMSIGLVSQVRRDPPLLNWIYVDKDTMEIKYGNKTASIEHHVGSWDWTKDQTYITLENKRGKQVEGFMIVENPQSGMWQMFFDLKNDGLMEYVPATWRKARVRCKRNLIDLK